MQVLWYTVTLIHGSHGFLVAKWQEGYSCHLVEGIIIIININDIYIAQDRTVPQMRQVSSYWVNKKVFSLCRNVSSVTNEPSSAGRLFHARGPWTAKLWSPQFVEVHGTVKRPDWTDHRWRRSVQSDTGLHGGTVTTLCSAVGTATLPVVCRWCRCILLRGLNLSTVFFTML